MMKRNRLLSLFFFITVSVFGQQIQLSPEANISVLTIGPGESLNDAFGHNAFRINDSSRGIDVVFGYGEYDFDTPYFYLKFAQGKLNYLISRHSFSDFYRFYSLYNRTIQEQVLNLSSDEKQHLYDYLVNNYKPENRKYLYDFFYDNCATRIRDVAEITVKNNIEFSKPSNFEPKTFRQLIHEHVGLNTWGSFGIDMALGSVIDKQATPYEEMFLPKYIHQYFGSAKIHSSENLVSRSTVIYQKREQKTTDNFLLSPLMVIGVIAILILYITYRDFKNKKRSKWLDISLFAITGVVGIIMLLLWFATDHTATAKNYNLLWAVPLNMLVIGQLFKTQVKNWFKRYIKFLIIMLCLLAMHWIIGIQIYAIGLIPLLLALLLRYMYLHNYFSKQ